MVATIGIVVGIAALLVATLALHQAGVIGDTQADLAEKQIELAEQQVEADNARRAWEMEQARRQALPVVIIQPGAISGGTSPYDFTVKLTNRSPSVPARGLRLTGCIVNGQEVEKAAGPFNLAPGEPGEGSITFDFAGTSEQLRKVASFRVVDHEGNEWTWEPVA